MTDRHWHPYQSALIGDPHPRILAEWPRQSGKSMTIAFKIAALARQADLAGDVDGSSWLICSRSEAQARQVMRRWVRTFCSALQMVVEYGERAMEVETADRGRVRVLAHEVHLPAGGRITAISGEPDAARGFTGNVWVDELAFHPRPRDLWRAIVPVTSKRGLRIIVTSTPRGNAGLWHELATGDESTWSRHRLDIHQAVRQGLDQDPDALRRTLKDELAWRQEYLCEHVEYGGAWLSYEVIDACQHPSAGDPDRYPESHSGKCYWGWDVARARHFSVQAVAEDVAGCLVVREMIEMTNTPYHVQHARLDGLVQRFRMVRGALDRTGLGDPVLEEVQRRHGAFGVDGVWFTAAQKLALGTTLKNAMEENRLRIPEGETLREDLHSVELAGTRGGQMSLVAPDSEAGHADRFWALALVAWAASGQPERFDYRPAGRAGRPDWQPRDVMERRRSRLAESRGGGRANWSRDHRRAM